MIKVVDLHKNISGKNILNGIDINIDKGKIQSIIGGSGTGKSVFLKNIIGLMSPDKGDVLINDVSVIKCDKKTFSKIRKNISMVFQNNALLASMNLFDNMALPLREHTKMTPLEIKNRINEKLSMVDLDGFENYFPAELSGGMRKRAGIARAIIGEPSIILYDEPTTGLDPVIANIINDIIIDLRNKLGVTSIVVTHDIPGALKISDNIAMLYKGKLVFNGSPDELKKCADPVVKQFVNGETKGPITDEI